MTKTDMMKTYSNLCDEVGISEIDGISKNSRKDEIQNAIDCLSCPEEMLNDYLVIVKLKYPNIHHTITENGDWKIHNFNRLYVFNTARQAIQ